MASGVIVSYDGTANDDDALALARMLSAGSLPVALAYVRHSREYDPRREEIAQHDADRRLELGAVWLEDPEVARHIVIDPSTGAGLARLAGEQDAALIVFGSDYRTSPGRVEPGGAAQHLLSGGHRGGRRGPGRPAHRRPRRDQDDFGRPVRGRQRAAADRRGPGASAWARPSPPARTPAPTCSSSARGRAPARARSPSAEPRGPSSTRPAARFSCSRARPPSSSELSIGETGSPSWRTFPGVSGVRLSLCPGDPHVCWTRGHGSGLAIKTDSDFRSGPPWAVRCRRQWRSFVPRPRGQRRSKTKCGCHIHRGSAPETTLGR